MERFIRQKYEHRTLSNGVSKTASQQRTGSTTSVEDEPPPLPPKPASRFGFSLRASSSTFPMSKSDKSTSRASPNLRISRNERSPPRVNKASRIMGATVGAGADSFESKLRTLHDMGFQDGKRNLQVLKGLNGSLEKSIETLIRLGESSTATPTPGALPLPSEPQGSDIAVARSRASPVAESSNPNNPFFTSSNSQQRQASILPPTSQVPTVPMQYPRAASASNPFNPYTGSVVLSSTPPPLEQSFQHLQITQSQLFPNNTGGFAPPVHNPHYNPFFQVSNSQPPEPANPQLHSQTFLQQQEQQMRSVPQGHALNPFPQIPRAQDSPSLSFLNMPSGRDNIHAQFHEQQPVHSQGHQGQQHLQSQQIQPYQQSWSQPQQQQYAHQQSPQPTPFTPHQAPRYDKASILALYDSPHLAPTRTTTLAADPSSPAANPSGEPHGAKRRSATAPVGPNGGSLNPFLSSTAAPTSGPTADTVYTQGSGIMGHGTRDSLDLFALQNGRHSPDAFASLSARYLH